MSCDEPVLPALLVANQDDLDLVVHVQGMAHETVEPIRHLDMTVAFLSSAACQLCDTRAELVVVPAGLLACYAN